MAQDYNQTIHLPKTEFPMRANLAQREPDMLKAWQNSNVYQKLLKKNQGKPAYVLHDGPPFSNGNIHMGTAMNKVLKDFIIRSKAMTGYYTPYVPGWDNHGMPIESAIIKKNKLDRKKMSIPEFRNACQKFAEDFVNIQRNQFIRLGGLGDWENPYLTMDPKFEAEEVKVFGKMYEKGYIYKGLKPVYWCPKDETALAEAEIEYSEDPCTSIYVKFAVKDDKDLLEPYGGKDKTYFIIWTTTTWTLPGNLAIALNPAEDYVLIENDANHERYIVAEALSAATMDAGFVPDYHTVATFKGAQLELMTAQHPFLDRDSLVVLADYVTMDSGTGCVHTAPGFGVDDYNTCRKYKMDMVVPVDDRGYQTEDAGKFAGMYYADSNQAILSDMIQSGALFASKEITHTYPHCWRCKNPIIFRATPQWFCSVDSFKEEAVEACEKVNWMPAWGKDRIESMVRERADWCISRQRHWGLPIPVFYCKDCGKPVCTKETIERISELFGQYGSNVWYEKTPEELVPEGFVCPHCGGKEFTCETDTLDGWFDSGSSHVASLMNQKDAHWPADMYLEGADQYRGWFQSSLLTAVGALGKEAPYKNVLTHGWVVDGEGKAMHKSLGNSIAPEQIINKYGADILRLWVASSDYRVDVRVSDEIFKQLSQSYLKIRNTCRYFLGNLYEFDANNLVKPEEMESLDRWILTKLKDLYKKVLDAYENFEYHIIAHAISDFCVVELSNFYLDVIKDRLYCEEKNGRLRRSAQTACYFVLDSMTRMIAPILAYTADEIWKKMPHRDQDDEENVVLNSMTIPDDAYMLSEEEMLRWDKTIQLRDEVNAVLEQARSEKVIGKSLEAKVLMTLPEESISEIYADEKTLEMAFIVSKVELKAGEKAIQIEKMDEEKCERCWCFSDTVGKSVKHPTLCARCAAVLENE